MTEFLPFQTFPSAEAAEPLLALLRERSIPFCLVRLGLYITQLMYDRNRAAPTPGQK